MSTDLQTTDNNGLQWVKPAAQNSVISKALLSPLVNQVSPEKVFDVLNVAIAKSYIDTGFKAPDATNQAEAMIYSQMVNELVYYVRQYASTYRVKELPIAIERGTQKEYGDYFGLNKTSFIQFVKGYKASEARAQALEAHLSAQDSPPTPPTIEQQFDWYKTSITNCVKHSEVMKDDIIRAGVGLYDFLMLVGLITYSKQQKEDILKQATSNYLAGMHSKKREVSMFQRQEIDKFIKAFELHPDKGNITTAEIINEAKKLTFIKYVEDMVLTKTDVEPLIEGKRAEYIKAKQSQ